MAAISKQMIGRGVSIGLVCVALVCPALAADDSKRHPVNCSTAPGDLRAIAAEKKHAEDQQVESVVSILPAGALLGLVTGTENKHLKMLSGDYIKQLDARAAEIKSTCGID
ncbi:hypothetical protein SAMN05444358_101913 [Ruegeria halocynthiae]|uniref:Uncharacterized protein n=1 Tax=Ruegeria halocynthiae TaxID=985054 RepID=A0A1H2TSM2_9RHOB|nr:hypothetical protein [Ruegeria halocynthiae]SDW46862.1 hypothetical protein SAMN05444358_101913 [Ruegeria halocynthiae]